MDKDGMTWQDHVDEALRQVNGGQHLRFINWLYRTKEVCKIAVFADPHYVFGIRDLGSVPAGNLDYIEKCLRESGKISKEKIDKEIKEKKELINSPGYFDEGINCWQDLLKKQDLGATTYDEFLEKQYNKVFKVSPEQLLEHQRKKKSSYNLSELDDCLKRINKLLKDDSD